MTLPLNEVYGQSVFKREKSAKSTQKRMYLCTANRTRWLDTNVQQWKIEKLRIRSRIAIAILERISRRENERNERFRSHLRSLASQTWQLKIYIKTHVLRLSPQRLAPNRACRHTPTTINRRRTVHQIFVTAIAKQIGVGKNCSSQPVARRPAGRHASKRFPDYMMHDSDSVADSAIRSSHNHTIKLESLHSFTPSCLPHFFSFTFALLAIAHINVILDACIEQPRWSESCDFCFACISWNRILVPQI
jgi:hypothetical protein